MGFRVFAMPDGPSFDLRLPPRLESWNRNEDPAQLALREFVAHVHELIDPITATSAGSLAFRLDIGLAEDIDPLWERDLDNYLFPVVRTLPPRVVSVWGTKGRGMTSRVRIEPAVEVGAPASWQQFEVPPSPGTERGWKAAVRKAAARTTELPPGPVALELSFALGAGRNWLNLWKPSIDGLEPLLGRTYPERHWNPLDGRIVRLGLHRQINAGLGPQVAMAAWARPADDAWPSCIGSHRSRVTNAPGSWSSTSPGGHALSRAARRADRTRLAPDPGCARLIALTRPKSRSSQMTTRGISGGRRVTWMDTSSTSNAV